MRKLVVAILIIAVIAVPSFAALSLELGVSGTPAPAGDGKVEGIFGFHVGVSPWAVLFASWDALVMPPSMISGMTSYIDSTGTWIQGSLVPGYLNLFDAGFRFIMGPVVLMLMAGTNMIYTYDPAETIGVKMAGSFGANLRVAAGLKFKWWGITVAGTSVFNSGEALVTTMKALIPDTTRKWAFDQIVSGLVPSLMLVVYIG